MVGGGGTAELPEAGGRGAKGVEGVQVHICK